LFDVCFLGVVDNEVGLDKKPYNILTYANGPGFYDHLSGDGKGNVTRKDINTTEITSFEIHQPATAPLKSETHSGADVGIFAIGKSSLKSLVALLSIILSNFLGQFAVKFQLNVRVKFTQV
jgi:hypothetical protein